jgi:hypothetical protein
MRSVPGFLCMNWKPYSIVVFHAHATKKTYFLSVLCPDDVSRVVGNTRTHMEACSNTPTVALRLVRGKDDKGRECLGDYNWAISFVRNIHSRTGIFRLGSLDSENIKYRYKFRKTWTHKNDCAGEDQQQLQTIDPCSNQRESSMRPMNARVEFPENL